MKRNLLAIAIPALLVAGAANASIEIWNKDGNKLNINGRVYASSYVGDRNNTVDEEGDKTTARLGFTGETQITDSITGYGRAEWEWKSGKGGLKETRYAFAGLNFGDVGSVDYGRNDGVVKAITGYTDVLPEFGGDAADFVVLGKRTDGVLTYRNSDFYGLVEGLSFAIQYADSDKATATSYDLNRVFPGNSGPYKPQIDSGREAYGLNVQYAIADTGLTVGGAYAQTSGVENAHSWTAGINYDANNLYLAATYIDTKQKQTKTTDNKNKYKGFEVVAQYGIDFEVGTLTPSLAYVQHENTTSGFKNGDVVEYVEVGATYDFNKNLTAVVDYKINLLDKDDAGARSKANTKDTVALGLIYQF